MICNNNVQYCDDILFIIIKATLHYTVLISLWFVLMLNQVKEYWGRLIVLLDINVCSS